MKLFFYFIVISSTIFGQNDTSMAISKPNFEVRRDLILFENNYGSIYFTKDTSAKSYNYFKPWPEAFTETKLALLMQDFKTNNKVNSQHCEHALTNSMWSPLYWFQNDYCLYSPSDWMNYTPIYMTDSAFYYLSSEPSITLLKTAKQIDNGHFEFNLQLDSISSFKVQVEIIDFTRGIAIWRYSDKNGKPYATELKVKTENVKYFPMIICDCGDSKCAFERTDFFETPNYETLKKKPR